MMPGQPKKTEQNFNIAFRIMVAISIAAAFTTLAADADVKNDHTNAFEQDLANITLFAFGVLQYLEAIAGGIKATKVFGNVTPNFDRFTSTLAILASGSAAAGCDLVRGGTSALPPQLFKATFGTLCASDALTATKRGFFDKDIKGAAVSGIRALVDLFLFFNVLYGIEGSNALLMYLAIPACILLAGLDTYDGARTKPVQAVNSARAPLLLAAAAAADDEEKAKRRTSPSPSSSASDSSDK